MNKVTCVECGIEFETNYPQTKFHNRHCRTAHYTRAMLGDRADLGLPTGTVGAISELRVCADLLMRGFEVFRAVSQCASCDLAVLKDGKLTRIEARTGYEHAKNGYFVNRPEASRTDVLAAVMPTRIVYEPDL